MFSFTIYLEKANITKDDTHYHRSESEKQELSRRACEFFRTLEPLDPQEIVDALSIVKQAGYVSDIKSNGGSGPVDVNLPGTSHLADGTIAGTSSHLPVPQPNTAASSTTASNSYNAYSDWDWDDINKEMARIFNGYNDLPLLTDHPRDYLSGEGTESADQLQPQGLFPSLPTNTTQNAAPLNPGVQLSTQSRGADKGAISYPTPSTAYDSPSTAMREPAPTSPRILSVKRTNGEEYTGSNPTTGDLLKTTSLSPVTTPCKRANREEARAVCKRSRKQEITLSPTNTSEKIVYSLLKSCVFGKRRRKGWSSGEKCETQENIEEGVQLTDEHAREILELGPLLFSCDPCETLKSVLQNWVENQSRYQHCLGIPTGWRGINTAAEYFIKLRSNEITDPIADRVAELLLFINYKDMCERPEDFCPWPRRKTERNSTYVLNCIIEAIPHYFHDQQSPDSRRDSISHYICYGGWWWKISYVLGIGLWLLGDEELFRIMKSKMFANAQIDALITYAFRVRPGTVLLLQLSNPIMRSLIRGVVPNDLVNAVHSGGFPLFEEARLIGAKNEDGAALAVQSPDFRWTNVVLEFEFPGTNHGVILSEA